MGKAEVHKILSMSFVFSMCCGIADKKLHRKRLFMGVRVSFNIQGGALMLGEVQNH